MSKQQIIIDTALRLFVERGIQSTSMSLLAKEANIAAGSIYNYFESKKELINELFIYAKSLELDYIAKHYDKSKPIKQRFRHLYGCSIDYMLGNQLPFKFFENYHFSPIITDESHEQLKELFTDLIEFYEDAKEMGMVKPLDPKMLHLQAYGGIARMIHWIIRHNHPFHQSDTEQILDIAWDAIAMPSESESFKG
ncbi:TetR/AcrR family transcriptional regulator [Kangiella sp. TOML190]|uniref:TetR/AcrR family transcriptional regulator n=1 Tax=Kangiella sp. TOML190 TaxID=2931351 RepID=UPI0020400DCE|nr:TetR/AcrR family transcriptional regulator [Kangiella sp. TOML190]